MAQNINFKGEWLNVPGVNLPKNGGGTAYFADASVTTAGKADVAQGKIFLDAAGQPQTGTNQGGGGTPTLETITKSYTPTESQQTETITHGSGYDGIEEVDVTIGAISPTYVGSGIARRDSTDLQDYDDAIVVPAGYYESQAVGQVALTTHPAPTVGIDGDGLITATHAQTAGYVSTSTKTATLQLTKRTSSDLCVNNLTVTAPAGYYPQNATKTVTVPTGSATTPATTITANPTITIDPDTGEITAAVSASQSVTPTVSAGYVSAGTAGTVSVSGSATSQMTVLQDSDIIGNILDLSGMISIRSNNAEVPAGWSPGIFSSQPLFPEAVFGTIDRFGVDSNGQLDVYFKANTAGMAYRTGSYQLTKSNAFQTQGATTITPSTSQQLAVDSSTYTTGQVVVDPIPSQYIVPSGSQTITQNSTVDVTALAEVVVNVPSQNMVKYALRPDATLWKSWTYDKMMHADENITIPSYSTSPQTIKASAALETVTLDRDNYYYYLVERMLTIPTYSVTTHNKGRCEYHVGAHIYEIVDVPASTIHALIDTSKYYTTRLSPVLTPNSFIREVYYSGTSTLATYSTQAYGVCQAVVAPSISSGSLTINSPTVTARGHTSYFTNTYFNAMTDIRVQYVIELYRAPKNSLNLEGWSNEQLLMQVINCAQSSTHKLT